ncbi:MAG: PepSY-associated TM helix domain-containing protein [Acidobacteriaceae bacterium]|nr:PepSY-associated TM helix domain-containing protein [Acidobacteriaceae bacterium]
MNLVRKYSRDLHGHLSFFFTGMILIYAISGLTMNHLNRFDPQYEVVEKHYQAKGVFPHPGAFTKEEVLALLNPVAEQANYKKHFLPNPDTLKVFLSSGSTFAINTQTGSVDYQGLKRRPLFFQLSYLHYNPGRWWRWFSDTFAISLIVICITGLVMNKGSRGFASIRGVEFALGILTPLMFLLFS